MKQGLYERGTGTLTTEAAHSVVPDRSKMRGTQAALTFTVPPPCVSGNPFALVVTEVHCRA